MEAAGWLDCFVLGRTHRIFPTLHRLELVTWPHNSEGGWDTEWSMWIFGELESLLSHRAKCCLVKLLLTPYAYAS
ncbi:unnamed protein product [Gulo gulo]|uniref:Uncharacterized protein n=1 Tax=Gulo gulo TaxID=48420 RepID=A0A9X9M9Q7_GULGU|nr:unnamed protein product [Gulo gulo]